MAGPLSPQDLEALIRNHHESRFLLVDVRRPDAFALDHIPGAVNIPAQEVDSHPLIMSKDLERIVFYCRNGIRSKAAAVIAMESGVAPDRIASLSGGIAAYTGEILLALPRLRVFDTSDRLDLLLATAINLEKGALRFYQKAAACVEDERIRGFFKGMGRLEIAHAKSLFNHLGDRRGSPSGFGAYFRNCAGDILEGGRTFDEVSQLFEGAGKVPAMLDMALDLEVSAYDLYKALGVQRADKEIKSCFFTLAQAEKGHMFRVMAFMDRLGI